jgi:hypothetical protein
MGTVEIPPEMLVVLGVTTSALPENPDYNTKHMAMMVNLVIL